MLHATTQDQAEKVSLTAQVQSAIEAMIVSGELRGGERVNEIALSEKFGTSRGPLREACRALAQEGLLVAIPNRGVFVRELSLREALEVYDIRAALDELMGNLIAQRASADDIAHLEHLIGRMETTISDGDLASYYPINLEFHDKLITLANNARLATMYKSLIKELHLFRQMGLLHTDSKRISNAEHQHIIEAIKSGDPITAGISMKNHVVAAKARLLAAVSAERKHNAMAAGAEAAE